MSDIGKTPVVKNISIESGIIYLGDKGTDGTWRIFADISTGKLFIQIRDAGVWTTRDEFSPTIG